MKMKTLRYRVKFVTPAFLGNAFQKGQWRVPPFKALLRQWWRVAYAGEAQYDVDELRVAENRLFGSASDDGGNGSGKSRVRLRLSEWKHGRLENDQWPGGTLNRVTTTRDGRGSVRSDVYLGFGSVLPPSKKQKRKSIELQSPPAIAPGDSVELNVQVMDDKDLKWIEKTIHLVHAFGVLGSRSRNGWGSLAVLPTGDTAFKPVTEVDSLRYVVRPIHKCFSETWPHAIGLDDNNVPLIWKGKQDFASWHGAIDFLAEVKVAIRRAAKDFAGDGVGGIHLLGYPAGEKWTVKEWDAYNDKKQMRYACPLKFKVIELDRNRLRVIAVHLPHSLPDDLMELLTTNQKNWFMEKQPYVWKRIHQVLDRKIGRISQENNI